MLIRLMFRSFEKKPSPADGLGIYACGHNYQLIFILYTCSTIYGLPDTSYIFYSIISTEVVYVLKKLPKIVCAGAGE